MADLKKVQLKGNSNTSVEKKIKNYEQLKSGRTNFESYWQSLHDYFYIEAQNINRSYYPGTELSVDYLWDSTTLESADVLASGFMNYLTPPASKWFRLRHGDEGLAQNKNVTNYLEGVAEEVNYSLNNSNFYQAAFPAYKGSGVYGTSVLLEEEDIEDIIRFYNLPVKQVVIVEDGRGRIAEYYIEFEYTAFQAMTRWGKEKLSQEMQTEAERRSPDKKHKFLLYIAKRETREIDKTDRENLPVQALWIDLAGKRLIDEGGYNEFPAMAHRFDKRPFIPWGFSPAMKALPFARILNAAAKTNLRAMMKRTDPPIAAPNNAFIMPFNGNPRAINYYKKSIIDGSKAIFPFANYGDPNTGLASVEYYAQKVRSLMYNDVFLAFQGLDKQMQNPEVYERINEKMSMLGPAVGRWTSEVLNPIVIRTIGILFRAGRLPKAPDEILDNPNYEIDYVSMLAQAQKRSELNALMTALTMTGKMAEFSPEVLDKVDPDKTIDKTWDILGAPASVLRDDLEVKTIRENRAQAQAQAQEMEIANAAAQAGKTAAEGDKALAEAAASPAGRRTLE